MGGWGDRARRPPQIGDRGTELIPNPSRIPPVCRGIALNAPYEVSVSNRGCVTWIWYERVFETL